MLKTFALSVLLGYVGGAETQPVAQVVSQGGVSVVVPTVGTAFMVPTAIVDTEGVTDPDTILRTTIQDPAHPEEPVLVETRRRIGETIREMARRHFLACEDIREVLAEMNKKRTTGTR